MSDLAVVEVFDSFSSDNVALVEGGFGVASGGASLYLKRFVSFRDFSGNSAGFLSVRSRPYDFVAV